MSDDVEVASSPTDGISSLKFSATQPSSLLATSWDRKLYFYNTEINHCTSTVNFKAPLLDGCWISDTTVAVGGIDRQVHIVDVNHGTSNILGKHKQGVRRVQFNNEKNVVVSGSWDKSISLFDPRRYSNHNDANNVESSAVVNTTVLPAKVFAMSCYKEKIVVGLAGRLVYIYDVRQMNEPWQKRESSLKFQTRELQCSVDGLGYIASSIEGRIAVEYFDRAPEEQAKKYVFKCHRQIIDGVDTIFPVNALAFHPNFITTFASGGSDGMVNNWDRAAKKRIKQYNRYPTGISAMSFNCNGSQLAIASSYGFEEGEKDHPADTIYIKNVEEADVRPKGG